MKHYLLLFLLLFCAWSPMSGQQRANSNDSRFAVFTPEMYGGLGDFKVITDAGMTASSATLASATAGFTTADVGKLVAVVGAGASGAGLTSTISAYVSATSVTLANAASTTVSGVVADYSTNDLTAVQSAINAAVAAHGTAVLKSQYGISGALSLGSAVTVEGRGVYPVMGGSTADDAALALPIYPPYLGGSVIVQFQAADIFDLPVLGQAINLRDFGVRFSDAIRFTNTGHGFYSMPPVLDTTYRNNGLQNSRWDNVCVWGQDGNHYGFYWCNLLQNQFSSLRAWGGGGFCIEVNGEINKNNYLGNTVFDAPYSMVVAGGSAHGYYLKNTNGSSILLQFNRPQTFMKNYTETGLLSSAPAAPQATFKVDPGGSQWLTLINPDLETNITGTDASIPYANGLCITPGLINHNGTASPASVSDFTLGPLSSTQGVLTYQGTLNTYNQDASGAALNVIGAPGQAAENIAVRDSALNIRAAIDSSYGLWASGGVRAQGTGYFGDSSGPGGEMIYASGLNGGTAVVQGFDRTAGSYIPFTMLGNRLSLWDSATHSGVEIGLNGAVTISGPYLSAPNIQSAAVQPEIEWSATNNGANLKNWLSTVDSSGNWCLEALNDASSSASTEILAYHSTGLVQFPTGALSPGFAAQSGTNPSFSLSATNNGANLKNWDALVDSSGNFVIAALNDASTSSSVVLSINHTTGLALFPDGVETGSLVSPTGVVSLHGESSTSMTYPTSGAGLELSYNTTGSAFGASGSGVLTYQAYDRTNSAFRDLLFGGGNMVFATNGTTALTLTGTGGAIIGAGGTDPGAGNLAVQGNTVAVGSLAELVATSYPQGFRTTNQSGRLANHSALRFYATGDDGVSRVTADGNNGLIVSTSKIVPEAFASLPTPSSANAGTYAEVSDATTNTLGAAVTAGGGSYDVGVHSNGTSWTVYSK